MLKFSNWRVHRIPSHVHNLISLDYYWVESDDNTITLYLDGKDPINYEGKIDAKKLVGWIVEQTLPVIIPLSVEAYMHYVFGDHKKDILIIVQFGGIPDEVIAAFTEFCGNNRDTFICSLCKEDDLIYGGVHNFLKFEEDNKNKVSYIKNGYTEAYIADFTADEATGK